MIKEKFLLKILSRVAAFANSRGRSLRLELPQMNVAVAGFTRERDGPISRSLLFGGMATGAGDLCMLSGQRIAAVPIVVESELFKRGHLMALIAPFYRIGLKELSFVRIDVTGFANL